MRVDINVEADILEDYLQGEGWYYERQQNGRDTIYLSFTFGNQDAEFQVDERGVYLGFSTTGFFTDEAGPFQYAEEAIWELEKFR